MQTVYNAKRQSRTVPLIRLPLVESLSYLTIALIFWLRDSLDKFVVVCRKVLSRALAIIWRIGARTDPMWHEKWGTVVQLQSRFWTGMPSHARGSSSSSSHAVQTTLGDSPATDAGVLKRAFEPSMRHEPSRTTLASLAPPLQSNTVPPPSLLELVASPVSSENCKQECFEAAKDLPPLNICTVKSRKRPATKKSRSKVGGAPTLKPESRVRIHQRQIFMRWNKLRQKRASRDERLMQELKEQESVKSEQNESESPTESVNEKPEDDCGTLPFEEEALEQPIAAPKDAASPNQSPVKKRERFMKAFKREKHA